MPGTSSSSTSPSATRRVFVTGLGAVTPLGNSARETWEAALAGRSGVSTLTQDWVEEFEMPVTFAAQTATPDAEVLPKHEAKRLDPSAQFAVVAARQAWADAGSPEVDPLRLAPWSPPASAACGRC